VQKDIPLKRSGEMKIPGRNSGRINGNTSLGLGLAGGELKKKGGNFVRGDAVRQEERRAIQENTIGRKQYFPSKGRGRGFRIRQEFNGRSEKQMAEKAPKRRSLK